MALRYVPCDDVILLAAVIFTALTIWTMLIGLCRVRPRPFDHVMRNVLVTAAHSDDCVVVGAEYAKAARDMGRRVQVVYLTCSGPSPASPIAQQRRREAEEAWSALGLTPDDLIFLDLPESPVRGPRSQSSSMLDAADESVRSLIRALPESPAIILPAAGETHVDHRTLRALVLNAVTGSGRKDVVAYEVPEYNSLLSLSHEPSRALRRVLSCVPGLGRIAGAYAGSPGFGSGGGGMRFSDGALLHAKQSMLRAFHSQNVQVLLRGFGQHSTYRELNVANPRIREEFPCKWVAFGHRCSGPVLIWSALLWATLLMMTLLAGTILTRVTSWWAVEHAFALACLTIPVIYLLRSAMRGGGVPQATFSFAFGIGGFCTLFVC